MLEIKKITRGFQVTLPQSFREKFHLHIGDMIEFIEEDGNLVVKPLKNKRGENPVKKLLSFLESVGDQSEGMSEEEILELAHHQRNLVRRSDENNH